MLLDDVRCHLLDDKVKVREGQHDYAEQRGHGAMDDGRHHQLERHLSASITSSNAGNKTLFEEHLD